jgi:hypothetical protein
VAGDPPGGAVLGMGQFLVLVQLLVERLLAGPARDLYAVATRSARRSPP